MAPMYKLTYFNTRGLAEPIRYIFACAGVEFEDIRIEKSEWPEIKPTTPLGKVPVLEVDGQKVHQTLAICRYLAKQYNLVGDTDWDALQIDILADTIVDMRTLCMDYASLLMKTEEVDEEEKAKKKDSLLTETMPFYLTKFENIVQENGGHFVSGKLTWVDLLWFSTVELLRILLGGEIIDSYPGLVALQEKLANLHKIKEWIEKRPVTPW